MKKRMRRMIVCMIVFALIFSTIAFAVEVPDLTKKCALLIAYTYDDVPVASAEFDLYRVGDLSEDYELSLSGDFADYPVEVNGLDDKAFTKAADTLAGYVALDGHKPLKSVTTDTSGKARFDELDAGLYLLIGKSLKTDAGRYDVENQLIILPYAENTAGEWTYELEIKPKATFEETKPDPLKLMVVKVWDDKESGEIKRPVSVTVHLLRDGEKFDTVVLDEECNWRHEWTDLDRTYDWSVAEDVPTDYTVSIALEGTKFIITNTCKTPPPSPSPTPPPSIPQTGQLWWPVPVLLLIGTAMLAMGFMWRREDDES